MPIGSINSSIITNINQSTFNRSKVSSKTEKASDYLSLTSGQRGSSRITAAYAGLNSAANLLNTAGNILNKIQDILTKASDLADRASEDGISQSKADELNSKFKKLGGEVDDLLDSSSSGAINITDLNDIEAVLQAAGLSKENSEGLADALSKIQVFDGSSIASTSISTEERVVRVSRAETANSSSDTFTKTRLTDGTAATTQSSYVTTSGSVTYQSDTYDPLNNNGGSADTFVTVTDSGTTSSLTNIKENTVLLAVSENSGRSLIKSSEDLLGYNENGYEQIYLVENGTVLQQLSNFTRATTDISSADLSADGRKAIFTSTADLVGANDDASEEVYSLVLDDRATLGQADPAADIVLTQVTNLAEGARVQQAKSSEDGRYVAYTAVGTGIRGTVIYDRRTDTSDTTESLSNAVLVGFTSNNTVALKQNTNAVDLKTFGVEDLTSVLSAGSYSNFSVSQTGQLAFLDEAGNEIKVGDVTVGSPTFSTVATVEDSADVTSISVSEVTDANANQGVRLTVVGQLESSDTSDQVYVIKQDVSGSDTNSSTPTSDTGTLFELNISTRADAQRVAAYLEKTIQKIEINTSALKDAESSVKKTLKDVAELSNALKGITGKLNSSADAEKLANEISKKLKNSNIDITKINNITDVSGLLSSD